MRLPPLDVTSAAAMFHVQQTLNRVETALGSFFPFRELNATQELAGHAGRDLSRRSEFSALARSTYAHPANDPALSGPRDHTQGASVNTELSLARRART